ILPRRHGESSKSPSRRDCGFVGLLKFLLSVFNDSAQVNAMGKKNRCEFKPLICDVVHSWCSSAFLFFCESGRMAMLQQWRCLCVCGKLADYPSLKSDAVNLDLHWLRPVFCGNMASEVANCCLAFWAAEDSLQGASGVDVGVFKELEKRFGILLAFTERLVVYALDRAANRVCLVLLNVQALNAPLEPVPSGWAELKTSAEGAYDFIWLGWVNAEADGLVKVDLEEEDCLGRVSLATSVVVSLESRE
ncbi:hypothetical protein KI387_011193, partial [Taxus chinensis]